MFKASSNSNLENGDLFRLFFDQTRMCYMFCDIHLVIGVYVCLRLWLAAHLCDHCVKGTHRLPHKDVNVIIIVRTALVHSA